MTWHAPQTAPLGNDLLDRRILLDPTVCPLCGAALAAANCSRCGADLAGPLGRRLWGLSTRIGALLVERDGVLGELRIATSRASTTSRRPTEPLLPPPVQPARAAIPAAGGARSARLGVQEVLLGLGALLLSVAAIVFLVVAWDRVTLAPRSVIVACLTLTVLVAAARVRALLPGTGEALGAVAVVLVLADAWAIRHTGLLGADQPGAIVYGAWASAGCAGALAGWGLLWRVRAGSVAAVLLTALAGLLAGLALPIRDGAVSAAVGLLAAALVSAVRVILPARLRIERALARGTAAGGITLGAVVTTIVEAVNNHAAAALLCLCAAVIAAVHAGASQDRDGLVERRCWSAATGVLAGAASWPLAGWLAGAAHLHSLWRVGFAPLIAAALAVGAASAATGMRRLRLRPRAAIAGAQVAAGLVTIPAAFTAASLVLVSFTVPFPAWAAGPQTRLLEAEPGGVRASVGALLARLDVAQQLQLACMLGLGACTVAMLIGSAWARAVACGTGILAVTAAGLAPALPLAAVVPLLAAIAVASGAVSHWCERASDRASLRACALAVAVTTATLSVVLAWAVPALSVPATLAGTAGLLLARRILAPAGGSALMLPVTVAVALAMAAATGLLGWPLQDRITVAAVTAAAMLTGFTCLPPVPKSRLPLAPTERAAGASAGLAVFVLALLAVLSRAATVAFRDVSSLTITLVAGTVAALAVTLAGGRAGRHGPAAASGALAPLTAGLAASLVEFISPSTAGPDTCLAIAAVTAAAGLLLSLLVTLPTRFAFAQDPRRLPAELGTALAGLAALATTPDADQLWIVLLLLGVASAAHAMAADRRAFGWVSGLLLTSSTWTRLFLSDVSVVEAYTLAPAIALLAVAAVHAWRAPARRALRAFAPGAGLALVPSIVASVGGGDLRPWLVLGTGAVLVVAARWAVRLRTALLAGAALAGVGVGLARPLGAIMRGESGLAGIERWSLLGAAVALSAAVVLAVRESGLVTRLRGAGLVPALVVAAMPSLAAAGSSAAPWRAGAVLAGTAAVALLAALELPAAPELPAALAVVRSLLTRPVRRTAVALASAAALMGATHSDVALDAWSLALGALLVTLGGLTLRAEPARGSWRCLGAGLAVALVPSLLLADTVGPTWRVAGLVVLAGVVVVSGAALRLQAPALLGGAILAVHAVLQLSPEVAQLAGAMPRWAVLAVVGAVLVALGATFERRMRELRAVRLAITSLR